MKDSIGMNYCAPDANVWAVNLDGRYICRYGIRNGRTRTFNSGRYYYISE